MKKKILIGLSTVILLVIAVHYLIGFNHLKHHIAYAWDNLTYTEDQPALKEGKPFSNTAKDSVGVSRFQDTAKYRVGVKISGHFDAEKSQFIPADKNFIASEKFDELYTNIRKSSTKYGHATVGLIDRDGQIIVKPDYAAVMTKSPSSVYEVLKDAKYGYVYADGRELGQIKYDNVYGFNEGICRVSINDKTGYINMEGQEIVAPDYDSGTNFINGMASIKKLNGKWGAINAKGKLVVPFSYDAYIYVKDGMAISELNGKEIRIIKYTISHP